MIQKTTSAMEMMVHIAILVVCSPIAFIGILSSCSARAMFSASSEAVPFAFSASSFCLAFFSSRDLV